MAKKQRKKTVASSQQDDLDTFEIDWDLIHSEVQRDENASTDIECSLTAFGGQDDDSTLVENDAYDFTNEEKFDFFVEVMAEEDSVSSGVTTSTATIIQEFDFTQDADLTQNTDLTQDTIQAEFQTDSSLTSNIVPREIFTNSQTQSAPATRSNRLSLPTRSDGLRKDVAAKIYTSRRKNTNTKYDKWWKEYTTYCRDENLDPSKENAGCHFFHDYLEDNKFGVGSIWSIYASINNRMRKHFPVNMNKWEQLKTMLIRLTKKLHSKKIGNFVERTTPASTHGMF